MREYGSERYYQYCPWHDRECIYIDYVDDDKKGYTSICMICHSNVRRNYPYQEEE